VVFKIGGMCVRLIVIPHIAKCAMLWDTGNLLRRHTQFLKDTPSLLDRSRRHI
jgi:hypothetical protein